MDKTHKYSLEIKWTGNTGSGTSGYRSYERSHSIIKENKPEILCSSDPAFRGDAEKYNPEELLVAAISGCHMLTYLHLCADSGIIVIDYKDAPIGIMVELPDGSGHFAEVNLFPEVCVKDAGMVDKANHLHKKANELCFIAGSCNFKVNHTPKCIVVNE